MRNSRQKRMLLPTEAATHLRVNYSTVMRWLDRGVLPYVARGGRRSSRVIPVSVVEALISSGELPFESRGRLEGWRKRTGWTEQSAQEWISHMHTDTEEQK